MVGLAIANTVLDMIMKLSVSIVCLVLVLNYFIPDDNRKGRRRNDKQHHRNKESIR